MKIVLDTHSHTIASGHAYSTIKECADAAASKGLALISITDHAPEMPGTCGTFNFVNLKVLPKKMSNVEILTGVELNILDRQGTVDLDEATLKNLDVVIASLHPPCIAQGTLEENTDAVIHAIQNPYIKIIGHLGDPRYPIDVEAIVSAAKENHVFLEINNSSLSPMSYRSGGEEIIKSIVRACKAVNHPITLGSDAHIAHDVGEFTLALKLIEEVEMPPQLVLNTSVNLFKEAMGL